MIYFQRIQELENYQSIFNIILKCFGLIDHYDNKTQELIISNINNKDKISKGDKVVTSGLADQLPSDLYIGEVTKVENDEYGLAKEVRVKTGANLSDIQHVYIAKKVITRISMKERLDNESVRLYNDRYHRFYLDTLIGLVIPFHIGNLTFILVPHLTLMYLLLLSIYRPFMVTLLLSIF